MTFLWYVRGVAFFGSAKTARMTFLSEHERPFGGHDGCPFFENTNDLFGDTNDLFCGNRNGMFGGTVTALFFSEARMTFL